MKMKNQLSQAIFGFIASRVENGSTLPDFKADCDRETGEMVDTLRRVADILYGYGDKTFGDTAITINNEIYDAAMGACCRYQEDGYIKGFIDCLTITGNIMNSDIEKTEEKMPLIKTPEPAMFRNKQAVEKVMRQVLAV